MAGILVFLKFILFKPYFNTVVVKCKGMTKCYFSWTLIQQILTLLYTIIFSNCSVTQCHKIFIPLSYSGHCCPLRNSDDYVWPRQ